MLQAVPAPLTARQLPSGDAHGARSHHRRPRPARRGVRRRRGERRAGDGDDGAGRRPAPRRRTAGARTSRRPRRARTAAPPSRRSDSTPRRRGRSRFETSCGAFVVTLDTTAAPATAASLVVPRRAGLLRRHGLPPHRPGLRHPGRRPDPVGQRRAGLLDRRPAGRRTPRYVKGVVAMAKTAGGAGRHVGQPVLRRHRRRRRPAARLRGRRRGHRGARRRRADRHARRPGDRAAAPADRHRVGHRLVELRPMGRIAAVVLAAGAATRFGAPKQRLLLPRVLERLAESPVDEIVVVEGAYDLRDDLVTGRCPRSSAARTGSAGRARRSAAGSRALGRRRRGGGRRSWPTGPTSPPRRSRACSRTGGRTAAPSSPRRTPESAGTRSSSRGPRGRTSRTTASVLVSPRLVPCDDLGAPGDVDTPADLPRGV